MLNFFFIKTDNFGDGVNEVFFKKLTNKNLIKKNVNNKNDIIEEHYICTGSIMCLINNYSIIYGTGFISETGDLGGGNFLSNNGDIICKPKSIISVRGPLTRKLLLKKNISCPENYGDPLILFPCIYPYKNINVGNDNKNIIGIIPHYIDKNSNLVTELKNNLQNNNYIVIIIDINVGENYEKLINNINKCNYIISSSLHGVIMGLVYQKKTCFLEFSNKVIGNQFKFNDFFSSLKINFKYKKDYTCNILSNHIIINYNHLINQGINLINICPFIENSKKNELKEIYLNFYK